jgi:ABC-type uncharacterized transport system permease subunit
VVHETSVFWLRAAAALYAIGLFHSLSIAIRKTSTLFRPALVAFAAGLVLHLVAIVEAGVEQQTWFPAGFANSVSLWAFLTGLVFLITWLRYRVESLGVLFFPIVCAMTTVAALRMPLGTWTSSATRNTWLVVHIGLVLLGYAALLLTAFASVLYLIQERQLKRKKSIALLERLPPLGTLDTLVSNSLGFGFILLTLGVVTGATWAHIESGGTGIRDPRVTSAVVTWVFCFLTLFLRISAGWRGRKAALMSVGVVASSAATWAFHYVIRHP